MIFWLDAILLINFLIAFIYFKTVLSPPFLMGIGMLAASILVSTYYFEWELYKMIPETIIILGGGTFFFTLNCVIYDKIYPVPKDISNVCATNNYVIRLGRLKLFYIISIFIGVCELFLKVYYLRTFFGSLNLSTLVVSARIEMLEGDNLFHYPALVRMMGSYTSVLSLLTIWLLYYIHFFKNHIKSLRKILLIHIAIVLVDAFLSGAKGNIFSIIAAVMFIFVVMYYTKIQRFKFKRSLCFKVGLIFLLLAVSFKGISILMGRNIEMQSNTDLLAEYCGAEIVNFDTYLQGRSSKIQSKNWGAVTFRKLKEDLGIKQNIPEEEGFQSIGFYTLGNVYTSFYSFHKDFGMIGCFAMPAFLAFLSMFIYRRMIQNIHNPNIPNIYLFIYTSFGMSLFMTFFSCKITETNLNMGYFRTIIYIYCCGFTKSIF